MDDGSGETSANIRQRTGLFLARFCVSAWIGAASLFVVVGVMEVTRGGFDSATKDTLVAIRFPAFYLFGSFLIGVAWFGALMAGRSIDFLSGRRKLAIASLSLVLVMMTVDYFLIYLPLLQMVTPPGQVKTGMFIVYHEASKWVNLASLAISGLAMMVLNWPSGTNGRQSRRAGEEPTTGLNS